MAINEELFSSLVDSAETALSTTGGRTNLAKWMLANTRLPGNSLKNWSFKGHEYQLGILKDLNPTIAIQKAAQTGISELMSRTVLALASKLSGEHILLVLPTSHFASKFVSTRIDPIIDASPRLQQLVSKKVSSTEIKQVGSSFIHIGGAATESQAISVPGRALFVDEVSFCNPDIVNVYISRLGHNREEDKILFYYSTPLYPGMGITDLFQQGSQNLYMCYHDVCGTWVTVDATQHIVLPGFDAPLLTLTLTDLRSGALDPNQAFVQCEHCHNPISQENLADPEKRAWVPSFVDRQSSSYQIDPLCAAYLKTPATIIRDLNLYKTTARWAQFALGVPYISSESTITPEAAEKAFTVRPINPSTANTSQTVVGMDQGKLAYLANGKVVNGVLEVFNMETLNQDGDNGQAETFIERFQQFNAIKGVIDAGPDASLVRYVQGRTPYNSTWGCYFIRTARRASLELFEEDEVSGLVKSNRTGIFDAFVKDFNGGKIRLPLNSRHEAEIKDHLAEPKRITMPDSVGEEQSTWVSKGPDHWFLALLYLYIAAKMVESAPAPVYIPPSRLVSKVKMKQPSLT